MKVEVNYPVYRKYPHNRTFFKIVSKEEFEELQMIGKYFSIHCIKSKILPDRNFIHDLTFDFDKNWIEINAEEYDGQLTFCENNLKRLV